MAVKIKWPKPGTPIHGWQKLSHREIGFKNEEFFKEYVPVFFNDGPGADLPTLNMEVKARDINTTSALSIGTMTTKKIIDQFYDQSEIKEKLQIIAIHWHNQVTWQGGELFNCTRSHIQEILRQDYEFIRNALAKGFDDVYLASKSILHIEQPKDLKNSYKFRISEHNLNQLRVMCASGKMFDRFFE